LQDGAIERGFSDLIHFENVKTFNITATAVAEACIELVCSKLKNCTRKPLS
jgi:hypothetical protein